MFYIIENSDLINIIFYTLKTKDKLSFSLVNRSLNKLLFKQTIEIIKIESGLKIYKFIKIHITRNKIIKTLLECFNNIFLSNELKLIIIYKCILEINNIYRTKNGKVGTIFKNFIENFLENIVENYEYSIDIYHQLYNLYDNWFI